MRPMQVRASSTAELLSFTESPAAVNPPGEQDAEMKDVASPKTEVLCTESQESLLELEEDPLASKEATPTTLTHVPGQSARTSPVTVRKGGGIF